MDAGLTPRYRYMDMDIDVHEGYNPTADFGVRPPTRAWEVARIVAPPSSVAKCLWKVFVWVFGVLFLPCVCVSGSGVLFSVGVCVCKFIISRKQKAFFCTSSTTGAAYAASGVWRA